MACDTGEDPFRLLPDDLLHHVLSFLPDDDALQTCVLDTRWRDLWRRTTSLYLDLYECRSSSDTEMDYQRFKRIADLIIHLRGNAPLEMCDISCFRVEEDPESLIEYALMCQVKELKVTSDNWAREDPRLPWYDVSFISPHLKILEFCNVNFKGSSLDFSGCPVLEDLTMEHCCIHAPSILSKSMKRLRITGRCAFPLKFRVSIVAPDLILLQLDGFEGLTPSLGYMPFLVSAYLRLGSSLGFGHGYGCHDFGKSNGRSCCDSECGCHDYPVNEGVLLNGLSNAVGLELIATSTTLIFPGFEFIYRRELEWCPVFGKLKTLLLNGWFTTIDLVCILQHTPILEILTLQLHKTKNLVGATEPQNTIEQPFVCANLKVVNIECVKVDAGVHKILKILSNGGILRERIIIKNTWFGSLSFSFEKHPHSYYCGPSCSSSHTNDDS